MPCRSVPLTAVRLSRPAGVVVFEFASSYLVFDLRLPLLPLGAFAVESGGATVDPCQGPLERFAFSLEPLTAPPRCVAWFRCAPLPELPLAYIRDPIALVSDLVALVRDPVALVGRPVSFVRATLSLIKLTSQLLEAGSVGCYCLRLSVTFGHLSRWWPFPLGFTFDTEAFHRQPRTLERFARLPERLAAPVRNGARPGASSWSRSLKLVGSAIALIRDPLALIGNALALIGHAVSFLCSTLSLIKLAAPLLQSGSLRTGALSSLTSPLGDSALSSGLIGSSVLLASLGVLHSQTGATLEHLRRAHEDLEQAP